MDKHVLIFIAGLHRSSTSMLHNWLAAHPDVSGFHNTGAPRDEGQHLQTVYLPASSLGGPGRFGFDPRAHLTEDNANPEKAEKLFWEWSQYWDLSKPVLVEKSPPNLLRTRFLRALFPNCKIIVITRHPIAVAYSTRRNWGVPIYQSLRHWCLCHEVFAHDSWPTGDSQWLHILAYEQFVDDAEHEIAVDDLLQFLNLPHFKSEMAIRSDTNQRFFDAWHADKHDYPWLESRVNKFGYSLEVT